MMPIDAPRTVRLAIALLWISLAISVLATVIDWEWPEADPDGFEWIYWAIVGVSILVPGALIHFASRRKTWARNILAILTVATVAALAALAGLHPEAGIFESTWDTAATIGLTMLDGVALWWLFTGRGALWFKMS